MKKKPLSKRAHARLRRLRRDPFGRFGLALNAYLATIGWNAVMIGSPMQIRGVETTGVGRYEFVVTFTGGRITKPAAPAERS